MMKKRSLTLYTVALTLNLRGYESVIPPDLVSDYIFTSERGSHSVPNLSLPKIDLPKATSSILMEIATNPVTLVD